MLFLFRAELPSFTRLLNCPETLQAEAITGVPAMASGLLVMVLFGVPQES